MDRTMELILRRGDREFKLRLFDPEELGHKHDPDIACCWNHFGHEIDDLSKIEAKFIEAIDSISPNYKARNVLRLVLTFLVKPPVNIPGDNGPWIVDVKEMMQEIDD